MKVFQKNHGRDRREGFTLVEVIVGVVLFGMVIATVFQIYSQSYFMVEKARDMDRITQTMQFQMEKLRGTPWPDLQEFIGTTNIKVDNEGLPTTGSAKTPFGWQAFKFTQFIEEVSGRTGYLKATLEVDWTDIRGRKLSHTYVTWFTENGLNDYYTQTVVE